MLLARARRQQLVDGFAQPRQDVRAAAGLDAADVAQDARAVGGALQPHDRRGLAVEDDDGDEVRRRHHLGGGARGLLGQLHLGAAHRSGFVDDQRQRQGGFVFLLGQVEAHGQDCFEAAAAVVAGAEAPGAAGDQQPAARAHEGVERGHALVAELGARDVGEDDEVVAIELGARRQLVGGAHVDGDVLAAEGARERGVAAGAAAFDEQHTRLALGGDGEDAGVVLGVGVVGGADDAHAEAAGARLLDAGGPADGGHAGRDGDGLLGVGRAGLAVALQAQARLAGAVGEQAHGQLEGSVRADLVGGAEAVDGDVALTARAAQGVHVDAHAARGGTLGGGQRVAVGGLSVGDHQEARDAGRIEEALAEAHGEREVGGGAAGRVEARDGVARWLAGGGRDLGGCRAEAHDAHRDRAAQHGGRGRLLQLAHQRARRGQVGVGDAVGDVDERDLRHGAGVAPHGRLRQRQREAADDQRAQGGLRDPLAAREIAQRRERDGEQRGRRREQPEPAGRAELQAAQERENGGGHQAVHRRRPLRLARSALSLTFSRGRERGSDANVPSPRASSPIPSPPRGRGGEGFGSW